MEPVTRQLGPSTRVVETGLYCQWQQSIPSLSHLCGFTSKSSFMVHFELNVMVTQNQQ